MNFLNILSQSPIMALVFLLAIISAVTIHEFAHAWTAHSLGDDTPRLQGRVTLNPAAHLELLGSLAFLLLGFGWGKPVIYNPMRLKRRSDELLIALAGPISNLLFALFLNLLALAFKENASVFSLFLTQAAYINVLLASFNMVPIPPLDGSSIIAYFWPEYRSLVGGQIGLIILLVVIFVPLPGVGNLLNLAMGPIVSLFSSLASLFGILG